MLLPWLCAPRNCVPGISTAVSPTRSSLGSSGALQALLWLPGTVASQDLPSPPHPGGSPAAQGRSRTNTSSPRAPARLAEPTSGLEAAWQPPGAQPCWRRGAQSCIAARPALSCSQLRGKPCTCGRLRRLLPTRLLPLQGVLRGLICRGWVHRGRRGSPRLAVSLLLPLATSLGITLAGLLTAASS